MFGRGSGNDKAANADIISSTHIHAGGKIQRLRRRRGRRRRSWNRIHCDRLIRIAARVSGCRVIRISAIGSYPVIGTYRRRRE